MHVGPSGDRLSDEDLAISLRHEYGHADRAVLGTHPLDASEHPTIVYAKGTIVQTGADMQFEVYLKLQDAEFARSIGKLVAVSVSDATGGPHARHNADLGEFSLRHPAVRVNYSFQLGVPSVDTSKAASLR